MPVDQALPPHAAPHALPALPRWLRSLRLLTLGIGPWVSVPLVTALVGVGEGEVSILWAVAVLLWCPLSPIGIPALLTQNARDEALPQLTGVLGSCRRAVLLVPHLAFDPDSPVRPETLLTLASWSALASIRGSEALSVAAPLFTG
jgi:hypothetical protein